MRGKEQARGKERKVSFVSGRTDGWMDGWMDGRERVKCLIQKTNNHTTEKRDEKKKKRKAKCPIEYRFKYMEAK